MKAVLHVIEHDFRNFFRYKWWLAGLISMNLADLFIMAVVYNQMVSPDIAEQIISYFSFFAPGVTIIGLFASAYMIGREINMEVRRQIHHYMLSLPITRLELAIGRLLAGGLRGMVYMSPLLLTTFLFLGFPSLPQLLVILGALFLLATGISGLSIATAVSTTSLEKFVTARGMVYYVLFFCSSIFYPLSLIQDLGRDGVMPQFVVMLAEFNPLSSGADLIRSFLLGTPEFTFNMIRNLVVFSTIFATTATFAYMKIIQRK
ncbi:MAG: ABC transporter permease [Candidatus Bathyarchaeota archaeon]|nr:ABC transporter permease [Candidatus Bathyarchaeota archaeon]MDH5495167.1 ABC transporter permease [Candidatus Bathyarchaeota archaeon]